MSNKSTGRGPALRNAELWGQSGPVDPHANDATTLTSFDQLVTQEKSGSGFFSFFTSSNNHSNPKGAAPAAPQKPADTPSGSDKASAKQDDSAAENGMIVMAREDWLSDKKAKVCYDCEAAFTMLRRRHHCRLCGQIFCSNCSKERNMSHVMNKAALPKKQSSSFRFPWFGRKDNKAAKIRVCGACFDLSNTHVQVVVSNTSSTEENTVAEGESKTAESNGDAQAAKPGSEGAKPHQTSRRGRKSKRRGAGSGHRHLSARQESQSVGEMLWFRRLQRESQHKGEDGTAKVKPLVGTPLMDVVLRNMRLHRAADNHLLLTIHRLLQVCNLSSLVWLPVVWRISRQACFALRPRCLGEDSADIRDYVRVVSIPTRSMRPDLVGHSSYFPGVVLNKTLPHKWMRRSIAKPRILLLGCAIEFQRVANRLSSMSTLQVQEAEFIHYKVKKLIQKKPDVVVVSKSVSRLAQEMLRKAGVTVLVNVPPEDMSRLARACNCRVLLSTDYVPQGDVGTCDWFHVKQFKGMDPTPPAESMDEEKARCLHRMTQGETSALLSEPLLKKKQTFVYFGGFPSSVIGTCVLHGAPLTTLQNVERVLLLSIHTAMHLKREVSLLVDSGCAYSIDALTKQLDCMGMIPYRWNAAKSTLEYNIYYFQALHKLGLTEKPPVFEGDEALFVAALHRHVTAVVSQANNLGSVHDRSMPAAMTPLSSSPFVSFAQEAPIQLNSEWFRNGLGHRSAPSERQPELSVVEYRKVRGVHMVSPPTWMQQRISFNMCWVTKNYQCIKPTEVGMDFYTASDRVLGAFINEKISVADASSSQFSCGSRHCKRSLTKHQQAFVYNDGRLTTSVCHLPPVHEVPTPNVVLECLYKERAILHLAWPSVAEQEEVLFAHIFDEAVRKEDSYISFVAQSSRAANKDESAEMQPLVPTAVQCPVAVPADPCYVRVPSHCLYSPLTWDSVADPPALPSAAEVSQTPSGAVSVDRQRQDFLVRASFPRLNGSNLMEFARIWLPHEAYPAAVHWRYCKRCKGIVTPFSVMSSASMELSVGKMLQVFAKNAHISNSEVKLVAGQMVGQSNSSELGSSSKWLHRSSVSFNRTGEMFPPLVVNSRRQSVSPARSKKPSPQSSVSPKLVGSVLRGPDDPDEVNFDDIHHRESRLPASKCWKVICPHSPILDHVWGFACFGDYDFHDTREGDHGSSKSAAMDEMNVAEAFGYSTSFAQQDDGKQASNGAGGNAAGTGNGGTSNHGTSRSHDGPKGIVVCIEWCRNPPYVLSIPWVVNYDVNMVGNNLTTQLIGVDQTCIALFSAFISRATLLKQMAESRTPAFNWVDDDSKGSVGHWEFNSAWKHEEDGDRNEQVKALVWILDRFLDEITEEQQQMQNTMQFIQPFCDPVSMKSVCALNRSLAGYAGPDLGRPGDMQQAVEAVRGVGPSSSSPQPDNPLRRALSMVPLAGFGDFLFLQSLRKRMAYKYLLWNEYLLSLTDLLVHVWLRRPTRAAGSFTERTRPPHLETQLSTSAVGSSTGGDGEHPVTPGGEYQDADTMAPTSGPRTPRSGLEHDGGDGGAADSKTAEPPEEESRPLSSRRTNAGKLRRRGSAEKVDSLLQLQIRGLYESVLCVRPVHLMEDRGFIAAKPTVLDFLVTGDPAFDGEFGDSSGNKSSGILSSVWKYMRSSWARSNMESRGTEKSSAVEGRDGDVTSMLLTGKIQTSDGSAAEFSAGEAVDDKMAHSTDVADHDDELLDDDEESGGSDEEKFEKECKKDGREDDGKGEDKPPADTSENAGDVPAGASLRQKPVDLPASSAAGTTKVPQSATERMAMNPCHLFLPPLPFSLNVSVYENDPSSIMAYALAHWDHIGALHSASSQEVQGYLADLPETVGPVLRVWSVCATGQQAHGRQHRIPPNSSTYSNAPASSSSGKADVALNAVNRVLALWKEGRLHDDSQCPAISPWRDLLAKMAFMFASPILSHLFLLFLERHKNNQKRLQSGVGMARQEQQRPVPESGPRSADSAAEGKTPSPAVSRGIANAAIHVDYVGTDKFYYASQSPGGSKTAHHAPVARPYGTVDQGGAAGSEPPGASSPPAASREEKKQDLPLFNIPTSLYASYVDVARISSLLLSRQHLVLLPQLQREAVEKCIIDALRSHDDKHVTISFGDMPLHPPTTAPPVPSSPPVERPSTASAVMPTATSRAVFAGEASAHHPPQTPPVRGQTGDSVPPVSPLGPTAGSQPSSDLAQTAVPEAGDGPEETEQLPDGPPAGVNRSTSLPHAVLHSRVDDTVPKNVSGLTQPAYISIDASGDSVVHRRPAGPPPFDRESTGPAAVGSPPVTPEAPFGSLRSLLGTRVRRRHSRSSRRRQVEDGPHSISPQSHSPQSFSVTVYYPKQFHALRLACCSGDYNFIQSLSRCDKWEATGGRSDSTFAKTADKRFILKFVQQSQAKVFLEMAPKYFSHMARVCFASLHSCLCMILGIYRITVKGRKKRQDRYVLVMPNLFYSMNPAWIFDLKGSKHNRYVKKKYRTGGRVLLDQNLMEEFRGWPVPLTPSSMNEMRMSIYNDTILLSSLKIIDYSIIVGIDPSTRRIAAGIIDYIRPWTWNERIEMVSKYVGRLGAPTVISPHSYKARFRSAMNRYFVPTPVSGTRKALVFVANLRRNVPKPDKDSDSKSDAGRHDSENDDRLRSVLAFANAMRPVAASHHIAWYRELLEENTLTFGYVSELTSTEYLFRHLTYLMPEEIRLKRSKSRKRRTPLARNLSSQSAAARGGEKSRS